MIDYHPGKANVVVDAVSRKCGPYPIHGSALLAFKWKENVG